MEKEERTSEKDEKLSSADVHLSFCLTKCNLERLLEVKTWTLMIHRNITFAFLCNLQSSDLSKMLAVGMDKKAD